MICRKPRIAAVRTTMPILSLMLAQVAGIAPIDDPNVMLSSDATYAASRPSSMQPRLVHLSTKQKLSNCTIRVYNGRGN